MERTRVGRGSTGGDPGTEHTRQLWNQALSARGSRGVGARGRCGNGGCIQPYDEDGEELYAEEPHVEFGKRLRAHDGDDEADEEAGAADAGDDPVLEVDGRVGEEGGLHLGGEPDDCGASEGGGGAARRGERVEQASGASSGAKRSVRIEEGMKPGEHTWKYTWNYRWNYRWKYMWNHALLLWCPHHPLLSAVHTAPFYYL